MGELRERLVTAFAPGHARRPLARTTWAAVIGYLAVVGWLAIGVVLSLALSTKANWQLTVTIIFVLPCLVLLWFLGTTLGGASAGERTVVAGLFAVAAIAIGSTSRHPS